MVFALLVNRIFRPTSDASSSRTRTSAWGLAGTALAIAIIIAATILS